MGTDGLYFDFGPAAFWITLLLIGVMMGVLQGTVAYLTLLERKVAAWTQDRLGPNRVGPWGLFQPLVDGAKFLLKEEIIPSHVDKLFYLLAPAIAVSTALLAFAVVPFGQTSPAPVLKDYRPALADPSKADSARPAWPQTKPEEAELLAADEAIARAKGVPTFKERLETYNDPLRTTQFVIAPHVDVGIVWVFAISSLAVYAVVLGGWSSNSKYSFLGSLRSSAQLISYEIPLGMSVLGVMLMTGSLNLERIIDYQCQHGWNFLFQPLAGLLFLTSVLAESNRLPFDLPESEQELVGGYHTEYSALKFGLFMLGEYTHMITTSFLVVALFFGGWHLPWLVTPGDQTIGSMIAKVIVFAGKTALVVFFYMLVRWTLPRFRFDQLMGLAWKVMMPLALINLVCVLVVKTYPPFGEESKWLLLPLSLLVFTGAAYVSLLMPRGPGQAGLERPGR